MTAATALTLVCFVPAVSRCDELIDAVRQVDGHMPAWLADAHVPGAAVAFVAQGRIRWSKGYGIADLQTRRAFTPTTVVRAASLSKTVAALCVLSLAEDGFFSLDQPIDPVLERWRLPATPRSTTGVTVRRLLSHTAGLSQTAAPGVHRTLLDVLQGGPGTSEPVRLVGQPGASFEYGNVSYVVLQLLVEDVTGRPFAALARERVLAPLGMERSDFRPSPLVLDALARGYDARGRPYAHGHLAEEAAGGLYSTAEDLARFVAALMPGPDGEPAGRGIVREEMIRWMMQPAEGTRGRYGLGVSLSTTRDGTLAFHAGRLPGWSARLAWLPDRGAGFALVANGDLGFLLHDPVTCGWMIAYAPGSSPPACTLADLVVVLTPALALGGALGLVLFGRRFAKDVLRYERGSALVLRTCALTATGLAWIVTWHTDIVPSWRTGLRGFTPAMAMPGTFPLLTLVIIAWCVALATSPWLRRERRKDVPPVQR